MDIDKKLQQIDFFRTEHGELLFDYLAIIDLQQDSVDLPAPSIESLILPFRAYKNNIVDVLTLLWNHPHRYHELIWSYYDEAIDAKHSRRTFIFSGNLSYIPLRIQHEDFIFTTDKLKNSELPELTHDMDAASFVAVMMHHGSRWDTFLHMV